MRFGKSVDERQWMYFLFFRKKESTKSAGQRTGYAFFYEPGNAKAWFSAAEKVNAGLER